MLPVLIYEQNENMRKRLLDAFDVLASEDFPPIKIGISTGSLLSMERALNAEQSISLVVLGIDHASADSCTRCTELGQIAMQHNRDNYTLYFVHHPNDLPALLQSCMRPAGILVSPFTDQHLLATLRRILNDYAALNHAEDSADNLVIESDSSAYRIPYGQIQYFEALDKKINIYTNRQCITVRKSLSSLEQSLPGQFMRCHRAFIVNTSHIGKIDFADMTITMRSNEILPISRSQRAAIKQLVDRRQEA